MVTKPQAEFIVNAIVAYASIIACSVAYSLVKTDCEMKEKEQDENQRAKGFFEEELAHYEHLKKEKQLPGFIPESPLEPETELRQKV